MQLVTLMIVACHVILGLPRRGCYWLFSMSQFIIQTTLLKAVAGTLPPYFQAILNDFPRDIRTATDQFNLEGKATVYAACCKCHATHRPTYEGSILTYPERCNARYYGSRCGELLVRPKRIHHSQVFVPIKSYIAFDFKDWLAAILSRPGYEELMDQAWQRMTPSPDGTLNDIFQGSIIRDFKGPDKRTHFSLAGEEGTGRYAFSLSFDFFNPLGNKQAGKKVSVGVISLVCLNLPIELRYKPENMFLASIIPGPKEPPLDRINPYLEPIISAFLEFWIGVRFTRTHMHALGRLILCAIVVVICDLPAARKVAGFSAHNHEYFCSICWCTKTQHSYDNFDVSSWQRRTNEECRHHAESFQTATTAKKALSSFDRTGLRWSELLRLPYYEPSRFLVVDPMHNLFLGLIKEHFQGILGYRRQNDASRAAALNAAASLQITIPLDPTNPLPDGKTQKASIRKITKLLQAPLHFDKNNKEAFAAAITRWSGPGFLVAALVYIGRGVGCLPPTVQSNGRDTDLPHNRKMSKKELAERLLSWVRTSSTTPTKC